MRSLNHRYHHHPHPHHQYSSRPAISPPRRCLSLHFLPSSISSSRSCHLSGSNCHRHRTLQIKVFGFDDDDDSYDVAPLEDSFPGGQNDDDDTAAAFAAWYVVSSSDGEDSDGEYVLNPLTDVDLHTSSTTHTTTNVNDALTVTTHRLALIAKHHRKHRIKLGIWINLALIIFLAVLLSFIDSFAWKIVRLPLEPFYLSRPFFLSAAIVSVTGYILVPLLKKFKIVQIVKREGRLRRSKERAIPTMGGLFFIPIGLGVARFVVGFSSIEVLAAAVTTLAFAAIGLLEDALTVTKNRSGCLSPWIKLALEAIVGTLFSVWLDNTSISSPYSMKMLVPLPAPLGLVCLGKCYLLVTSVCFVSMANGVNLTNGLDGLAGGTTALTFIGMSVAVLPISSEIAIFGASMAGACVGFLLHNQYKASVLMGETGSLALGGALAAMAACTGMFFPLFISSGIFVLEASSVIAQVLYLKTTKRFRGPGGRLLCMAPIHHYLQLYGIKEPVIVAGAYVISCVFALFAGYVGLISA